ncbi:alpha/beta hydrolase family protein [Miniphocaeibacter massiliensis]|uniref:alpha/beta hydrolase family protein n=1 Tax=Miniphocaeibacter massiliensis TaxID=2041841 RepID=UPI000C1BB749|nr:alpha/beta fold hydrolase [Miniphocaeibacter massiliensis]
MQYKYIEIENEDNLTLRGVQNLPDKVEKHDKLPAIIIIHGHTGNKMGRNFFFVKMSKYFTKKGFTTFRFDLNGTGESDGEFENMTLTSEIHDMDCIVDYVKKDKHVNTESIFIIGHSMGGLIATLKACEYNPKKMVLLAPANDLYESLLSMYNSFGKEVEEVKYFGLKIKKVFMDDMEKYKPYGRAKLYRGDTIIFRGSNDESVSRETCIKTKNAFKGKVEYIEIENTDHSFTDYDAREAMIEKIYEFLK